MDSLIPQDENQEPVQKVSERDKKSTIIQAYNDLVNRYKQVKKKKGGNISHGIRSA